MWHFVSTEKECPIVEGHLSRAEFSRKILVLCLTLSNKKKNSELLLLREGGDKHPAQSCPCITLTARSLI